MKKILIALTLFGLVGCSSNGGLDLGTTPTNDNSTQDTVGSAKGVKIIQTCLDPQPKSGNVNITATNNCDKSTGHNSQVDTAQ